MLKHLAYMLLAAAVVAAAGAAAVNQSGNASDSSPRIGSSATGSGVATQGNGTLWKVQVIQVNRTSNTSIPEHLAGVSFDRAGGRHRVNFTGFMRVPTPCHVLDHRVEGTSSGEYLLNIETGSTGGACIQVLNTVEYRASFEARQPFDLEVVHGNDTVETLSYPQEEKRETSLIDAILSFLSSLLG